MPSEKAQTGTNTISPGSAGGRLIAIRFVWLTLIVLAIALWIIGTIEHSIRMPATCPGGTCDPFALSAGDLAVMENLDLPVRFIIGFFVVSNVAIALAFFIIGSTIAWRKSADWMGLLVSFTLVYLGAAFFTDSDDALWRAYQASRPLLAFLGMVGYAAIMLLLFYFPDGRFVLQSRAARITGWLITLLTAPLAGTATRVGAIGTLPVLVTIGLGLAAQIYRYRRVSGPEEQQQTKWILFGLASSLAVMLIWVFAANILPPGGPSEQRVYFLLFSRPLISLLIPLLPLSIALSILRYRLWDVDVVLNRTLVYSALTACVVGLYVLIVGGAGLVIRTSPNLVGLLIATGLIGVLYRPMRALFQRGADRIFHPASPAKEERDQDQLRTSVQVAEPKRGNIQEWDRVLKPLWIVAAVHSGAILLASLPGYLVRTPIGNLGAHLVFEPTPPMLAFHHFNSLVSISSTLLSLSLAGLLFIKKFNEPMGRFLAFYLLAHGILFAGSIEMLEPFWPEAARVNSFVLLPFFLGPATIALIGLFPDGRFIPAWSRWLVPAPLVLMSISWLGSRGAFFREPAPWAWPINAILTILSLGILFALVYIPIYRYRHVSTPEQRQQTRWVVYGFCLVFLVFLISGIPWTIALNLPPGSLVPWWLPVSESLWFLGTAILPVTLTVAVMRYRLYDIDFLINRTLVYGALSGSVIAIYVLIVGVVGTLMQAQGNLLITLLATGLIAVLFQPLRERLQRRVNRLIYGERDDPIEALSRLGKQMETALPSDQVLPALVRTIAHTLRLPFVGITLKGQQVTAFGQQTAEPVAFPLTFQGETTGELLASPRNPGENFTPGEMRLLQNLARQAGAAVRNAQLTADLQRSRQTIVTAREEERHRLRRDLHDGIGPTMAGLTLKLDAARDLVSSSLESGKKEELEEAVQLLTELKTQTQETVQNIRHIVHTLRPPSLDVLGLVPALQAHFGQVAIPDRLEIQMTASPQNFPRLSAAVEVAAYRIVLEAVTNVMQHAHAGLCEVSLTLANGNLKMEIKDDGVGLPKARSHGIGLDSMRERAEELGGRLELSSSPWGTCVSAEIPVSPPRKES
ncbi:MAG TPA: ATP-binding protein [Anaerolineales bacterium]|nr:ATP-binding protein [Anaerolineales bacterium]